MLTHGYDDPSIDGLIMAAPTHSKVLYMQRLGRGMRPSEGKENCKVLDVVDVSKKHTLTIGKELTLLQDAIDEREKSQKSKLMPWQSVASAGNPPPVKKAAK